MIERKNDVTITRQCELLGISRSTLYYKPKEMKPCELERIEKLMATIDELHTEMPCIGQRKIKTLLNEQGFNVGRKLVRRLMHEMGITPIYPKPNLSKYSRKNQVVPYLLRNTNVFMPNQVWSIDITYIKLRHSHMYLTAVIDWCSRMIVGWDLSDTLDTAPVIKTVREAVNNYGIPGIINSDQGVQFTSIEYKEMLKDIKIRQSMDGKSRWADNIMIERWFRSLKTELIYINEFNSPRELYHSIRDYITQYNTRRPHAALDNRKPAEVYRDSFRNESIKAA